MKALDGKVLQLHREARDVDAVAHGVALVRAVRFLEKIGDVLEDLFLTERQIFLEDLIFLVALGEVDQDLRLKARVDVFGEIEGGGVVVQRGNETGSESRNPRSARKGAEGAKGGNWVSVHRVRAEDPLGG